MVGWFCVRRSRDGSPVDGCRAHRGAGRRRHGAVRRGDHVTPAKFEAGLAQLEARLARRLITAGIAIAGIAFAAAVTLTVATLRLLS